MSGWQDKPYPRTYPSERDNRTPTPGVYRRNGHYRVLWRPDGKRKKMERFATYAEAVAFKHSVTRARATPTPRSNPHLRYLLDDPCPYCGEPSQVFDHVHPRARGGSHDRANIVGACAGCNAAKSDKSLLLFLLERLAPDIAEGADLFALLT